VKHTQFSKLRSIAPDQALEKARRAKEAGPAAIDATIGEIRDEHGRTLVLPSVRKALGALERKHVRDFGYMATDHAPEKFCESVQPLIGKHPHIACVPTEGGTGAMKANVQLVKNIDPDMPLIATNPGWSHLNKLVKQSDMDIRYISYMENGEPDVEMLLRFIRKKTSAVLFQGFGHNPTGSDYTHSQWQDIAKVMGTRRSIALMDIAYQGLANVPEADTKRIQTLVRQGVTVAVAWSGSKNHTLYNERVGLAAAITADESERKRVGQHYGEAVRIQRAHGPRIVATVQNEFGEEWLQDLTRVRSDLFKRRERLQKILPEELGQKVAGSGLFTMLPLRIEQIQKLEELNVFIADDGRINIGGIPLNRMEELAEKIKSVL